MDTRQDSKREPTASKSLLWGGTEQGPGRGAG